MMQHTGHAPTTQYIPQTQPEYGIFEAHFNNAKRRAGRPIKYEDAYGSLYPDGHVHLHTRAVETTDFTSFGQMREYLATIGECRIVWLAAPIEASKFVFDREDAE